MKILIADDHAITREGTCRLLEGEPDLQVVAEAADGEETVRLAQQYRPDVLLLDINMPRLDGVGVARILHRLLPELRILVLTGYDTTHYVKALTKLGVTGYLSKSASARELITALRKVHQGETYVQTFAVPLASSDEIMKDGPTPRELEVLRLAAKGRSNAEIAQELRMSQRTVQFHLANLFTKLEAESRTEMVFLARKRGWIE